ncbi:flagellar hook-length control protein FliK [Sulfuriferula sp.]|uniref:flagellar hook-length control protein FliK n=1 Tax=Sulfuriferula sp. TaxID=2025307 RepID=UPI002730FEB6|nr:flagellar hook-length control protein FliK [Sulfuriferula sp.]MDP2025188.1 flagellar hook-length control protein FliK [Sulfuriferula sp.]
MTPVRPELAGARLIVPIEALMPVLPLADAREEASHRFTQSALGQQFQGKVLSRLDDGSFLVRIADTAARMVLPAGTRVGDLLPLTLKSREPQLTFLLGAQPGAAMTSLSATGRLIDSLLHTAQQTGAPDTIAGKTALIASPATSTPQIAVALHDTLSLSGLFYEAHVREWANGNRSLPELMREPQAQAGQALLADLSPALQADPTAVLPRPDANSTALTQLINQQLNTLEQQRVLWRGEAWPGQPMEWEVGEDTPDGSSHDMPPSWHSKVRFELPTLGTVAATIRLTGDRLHIQIHADTEPSAVSLRAHGAQLSAALDAAGIPLDSLIVKQDE